MLHYGERIEANVGTNGILAQVLTCGSQPLHELAWHSLLLRDVPQVREKHIGILLPVILRHVVLECAVSEYLLDFEDCVAEGDVVDLLLDKLWYFRER